MYEPIPQNTSKVSVRNLMYPNSNTFLLAHFQPWFKSDSQSHIATGYNSNDPTTVHAQLDDMKSRGFQGLVIDWYGQHGGEFDGWSDGTTRKVKADAAGRCRGYQDCDLLFAIMEDKGALAYSGDGHPCDTGTNNSTANCIYALERDLGYMASTYFGSKAYLKIDPTTKRVSRTGRPAVFLYFQKASDYLNTNWATVWNTVIPWARANAGNPLYYCKDKFQPYETYKFPDSEANGAFAWPNWYGENQQQYWGQEFPDDRQGFEYLVRGFYDPSLPYYPSENVIGAAWGGFDDYLAFGHVGEWQHPVIYPRCGTTFVQSFSKASPDYSQSRQLPFLGVATWNDYDEGTEIETGLDNCVTSFTESLLGRILSWDIQFGSSEGYPGSEITVYQYIILYGTDGTHLYKVGTLPQGTHQVDLCTIFPNGNNVTMYVEAQGMPSVFNHVTNGSVIWNGVQCTYQP